MRRPAVRPIRLAIVLATAGALALTACGDDDDGGGRTEAFCEELETFATDVDDDAENGDESFVADFRAIADVAPSEIADEINQMLEAFQAIDSLPDEPESEEVMNEMLALVASVEEPSAAVEEFALENCPDLPPSIFGG